MIDKEVAELRRRYRQDRSNITKIHGCYVNVHGELVSAFTLSMGLLPEGEQEKYLELLKKGISGRMGKTLSDLSFSTAQVADSDEHRLLMRLRDSGLEDEEAVQTLYEKIAGSLHLADNYLILLAADRYDVPFRSRDGFRQEEGSEQQFSYILCSICPVKETKPVLRYDSAEGKFHERGTDWVAAAPEVGFLFPAFDDRATNLYGALYYTKNTDSSYEEFVSAVFNLQPPMPAGTQRETFREVLTDALEDECSVNVVQNVHTALRELVLTHKETRAEEPLAVTRQEVGAVLEHCGVSEPKMAAFNVKYDEAFGGGSEVPPQNLLGAAQLEYRTPDVVIRVNPDRQDLVQTRVLGGAKYLLINVDEGMELNGVSVRVQEEQKGRNDFRSRQKPAPGFFLLLPNIRRIAPQLDQVRIAAPFRAHTGLQIDLLRALQRQPETERDAGRAAALLQPHQGIVHRSAEDGIHFLIVRHGFALPKSLWIA